MRKKTLADFYKKGESSLLVFGNGQDLAKLRLEIEDKNKKLQDFVTNVATENIGLKDKVTRLENDLSAVNRKMEHFFNVMDWTPEEVERISVFWRAKSKEISRGRRKSS